MARIVFDIGGTNTRVARVERNTLGEVVKVPSPENREEWSGHLLKLIEKVSAGEEAEIVGGVASLTAKEKITAAFPKARIYNDALLAGFGEAVHGAGKDKERVAYIGIGTGIGTGLIENKKLPQNGFEAGHHFIDVLNNKTWEDLVSGHALKEKYGKYPKELDKEIYDACIKVLAAGVYNAILFWNPDIVVLGGALVADKDGYDINDISKALNDIKSILHELPPIKLSALGDNAGLHGAVALIENELKAR